MKRILLIGGNYFPEQTGIGRYNGEMMDWFSKNGYHCEVITSYPYYPQWKISSNYIKKSRLGFTTEKHGGVKIHRCPLYVPATPTGFKRMLMDFSFSVSSFLMLLKILTLKKFDMVIVVAPSFQLGMLGSLYKRIRGGKFVYHIQDMQIEVARDLGMINSNLIIRILLLIESYIFKRADIISSISKGMIKKIKVIAKKDVLFFPNWSNINHFFPLEDKNGLKAKFGFDPDNRIILYSGAIGEKQGLDIILSLASKFSNNPNIIFLICGSGPYKKTLKQKAIDCNCSNVVFLSLQPKELLNEFLNMADIHLIIQKNDASDLVMPSKLTNILAVGGVSITTANVGTNLYDELVKNKIGVVVPAENEEFLFTAVQKVLNDDLQIMQMNARKYAERNLAIDKVLNRFIDAVDI